MKSSVIAEMATQCCYDTF